MFNEIYLRYISITLTFCIFFIIVIILYFCCIPLKHETHQSSLHYCGVIPKSLQRNGPGEGQKEHWSCYLKKNKKKKLVAVKNG